MSPSAADRPGEHMALGVGISPTSAHVAAWRHPDAVSNAGVTFDQLAAMVTTAERAKLDFAFLADELAMPDEPPEVLSRDPVVHRFEPMTLIAALAAVTDRIGLVVTQTTTYNEPYHLARKLASLDHLSDGRAGWNLVTSYVENEARQFGSDGHAGYVDRYGRAREFFEVVAGLWDSWDDDAFVLDKGSGQYFDPAKARRLDHDGTHFRVAGPLNVVRPPQGRPVVVQAGSSGEGLDLAANVAEVVFTAQRTVEGARAFYDDLKGRVAACGRDPRQLRILTGLCPIVGATAAEARATEEQLQRLIHPVVGLARLSQLLGFDVSTLPLDEPLPVDLPETNGYKSRQRLIVDMARRDHLTVRQLYVQVVGSYGHPVVVGTGATVADFCEEWFCAGATDGFLVLPMCLPATVDDFADEVVPLLRQRGLVRTEYEGTTLRDHLGLPRPDLAAAGDGSRTA